MLPNHQLTFLLEKGFFLFQGIIRTRKLIIVQKQIIQIPTKKRKRIPFEFHQLLVQERVIFMMLKGCPVSSHDFFLIGFLL